LGPDELSCGEPGVFASFEQAFQTHLSLIYMFLGAKSRSFHVNFKQKSAKILQNTVMFPIVFKTLNLIKSNLIDTEGAKRRKG